MGSTNGLRATQLTVKLYPVNHPNVLPQWLTISWILSPKHHVSNSDSKVTLGQCWQLSPTSPGVCQYWPSIGKPTNHLKWLADGWATNVVLPTWCQCWVIVGKVIINILSQICWGMVGKGLASQHSANLIPILGQCWNYDHLLLFPKNCCQMVGNWSGSQHLSA